MIKRFKTNYRFIFFLTILVVGYLIIVSNYDRMNDQFPAWKSRQMPETKLKEAFLNYIYDADISVLQGTGVKTANAGINRTVFEHRITDEPDLFYLPVMLWQVDKMSDTEDLLLLAENHCCRMMDAEFSGSLCTGCCYCVDFFHEAYLDTKEVRYLNYLIMALSRIISESDCGNGADSVSYEVNSCVIENLLITPALFFASKESGDPVFKDYAVRNSELIYKYISQSLLNPAAGSLYCFSFLSKETGVQKYKQLSYAIADSISCEYGRMENKWSDSLPGCLTDEMDLFSQALVCNALHDLSENKDGYKYLEVSESFYRHILDILGDGRGVQPDQLSFRLFYFLLKYERKL